MSDYTFNTMTGKPEQKERMTPEVSLPDTLRHIADDHPCCAGSLLDAAARIEELEARLEELEKELAGIALVSKGPYGLMVFRWRKIFRFIYDKAIAALATEEKKP